MGHPCTDKAREKDIADLNVKILDSLIVTDKLGTTGYNLVTANHVIFLRSLYSATIEHQAVGMLLWKTQTNVTGHVSHRL